MLKFIPLTTFSLGSKDPRKVTIAYDEDGVLLFGSLAHNTLLVIDQKLVDDLQTLVNYQKVENKDV